MHLRRLAMLAVPLSLACSGPSDPGLSSSRDSAVLVDDLADAAWPRDAIRIDSVRLGANGRLRLFTNFGGGCQEHTTALLVSRSFMESQPPALRARIAHDANNDYCKALLMRTLEIDLEPVRDHYAESYGAGGGTLVLLIDDQRFTYEFR